MSNGFTFHSAFKFGRVDQQLSTHALQNLKLLFDSNVVLVIVDEISMFSGELLYLLYNRLQALYKPNGVFGEYRFYWYVM